MARATDASVRAIIAVKNGADLAPFIAVAGELVDEFCTDSGYTDARLAMIETWLAAHFYAIEFPRTGANAAGPVNATFQPVKVDLGLNATTYGQQAMVIDTAGTLAAYNNSLKTVTRTPGASAGGPGAVWLGTPREPWY